MTAVAATAATAAAFTSYDAFQKHNRRRKLARDVLDALSHSKTGKDIHSAMNDGDLPPDPALSGALSQEYSETLTREQLARNYAFFGEDGMEKIRSGRVAIIGCGGVGSWAAVMLARSGVQYLRLVDFDQVTLSSLNRHATAELNDVGIPKVKCIEKALRRISRTVQIDSRTELWRKEDGGALLEGVDWVVDAIDNIQTKVDLLKYCHEKNIKVFASMGAGAKCDPTRVQISDISYTMYDPLARSVRRRLRVQGVASGVPVVYSTEVPGEVKLLPLAPADFEKGNVKELGAFDDFRVRILPVIGPLPSIFGLHVATYVLCELAQKPISNPLTVKYRKKLYERMYKDLLHLEEKVVKSVINRLPIDEDDVGLIFDDLHRGRSVLPPHDVPTRPTLVRWDVNKPISLENVVTMDFKDVEKHSRQCLGLGATEDTVLVSPAELWGEEVQRVVERRHKEIKEFRDWVL